MLQLLSSFVCDTKTPLLVAETAVVRWVGVDAVVRVAYWQRSTSWLTRTRAALLLAAPTRLSVDSRSRQSIKQIDYSST